MNFSCFFSNNGMHKTIYYHFKLNAANFNKNIFKSNFINHVINITNCLPYQYITLT